MLAATTRRRRGCSVRSGAVLRGFAAREPRGRRDLGSALPFTRENTLQKKQKQKKTKPKKNTRTATVSTSPRDARARAQALVLSALALLFVVLWRSPPPRAEAAARAAHGALSAVPYFREYAWGTPSAPSAQSFSTL